jgi:hypothetical protein
MTKYFLLFALNLLFLNSNGAEKAMPYNAGILEVTYIFQFYYAVIPHPPDGWQEGKSSIFQ